ncbi:MAG: Holliday junction branch migration protein RuvA [Patescibacteria group bacterium]|nr:Holliday junction branch migration protein RuvA [Patescibacteria group bacterium]MDE1945706.1 Holliday junction branch migration protein RuvA [Patescibacteria group bacterium]
MIAKLEGIVWDANPKFLTVGVGGVGFKVYATNETKSVAQKGANISLFTHLAVREDALDLYGFLSEEELDLFELLIGVSGIGPKTALGVLSASSPVAIRTAVASGETAHLTKVSGIGKKIADKIVLELKDKIGASGSGEALSGDIDAIEALQSLGYSHADARDALKKISKEIAKTGDRVKAALKILGK